MTEPGLYVACAVGLAAAGVDRADAVRQLAHVGAVEALPDDAEARIAAMDLEPTLRDQALLLLEQSRMLAERAEDHAADSGRLQRVAGDQADSGPLADREDTADARDVVLEQREDTADARDDTLEQREDTADARDDTLEQREDTADARDDTLEQRPVVAEERDSGLDGAPLAFGRPDAWTVPGVYLLAVAAAVVVHLALPQGAPSQAWLAVGVQASVPLAIATGIRLYGPAHARVWWWIAGGQVVYIAANWVWYVGPEVYGWVLPFPSVADALYLTAYAVLAGGLWRLASLRTERRLRAFLPDIGVVTISLGSLAWLYLMAPYVTDASLPMLTKLVAAAYPMFDIALVAILAGMLLAPGTRPSAFWLLAGSAMATLAADVIYTLTSLAGTFTYGSPYFVLWLASYGLLAAAALHPSMRSLSEPDTSVEVELGRWRFWALPMVLGAGVLGIGAYEFTEGHVEQLPVAVVLTFALVLVARRQRELTTEVTHHERVQSGLEEGRDSALEASRAKGEFLATMSHEIRTPMNAVIGMAGLLADSELDVEQRRYVSGIRTSGEALLTLINDILDFSKIEAGRVELEEVEFDLEELVEGVADLFDQTAREKGVGIYSFVEPSVPRLVRGDAGRVRQVLVNLVGNAVKFTEQGRIMVRVRPGDASDDDGRQLLVFEVADTGVGIPEDARERIFETFVQVDASNTRRHGGTGLGLAISSRLVDLLGGHIELDSEVGVGTTFRCAVELGVVPDAPTTRAVQPLAGARILVADGDPIDRELIVRQTRAWAMHPTTVVDGREALEKLTEAAAEGRAFAMVLLDHDLPGLDGLEVARHIGADPGLDTAVAIMTGSPGAELTAAARTVGVHEMLSKPVRQSDLYDTLVSLALPDLSRGQPETTPRSARTPRRAGTVLLVEDNPANQLVGSRIVEKLGFRVDVVADGREALDALALRPYDAVLMDCQMPTMDGFEATRRLREREGEGRRTPVIAMTAGVTTEDKQRCDEAGMDDFLGKPVRPEVVAETLDRWITTRHAEVAPPVADDTPERPDAPQVAASSTVQGDAPDDPTDAATAAWAARPRPDPQIIDPHRWDVLLDLMTGDRDLLTTLIRSFLADSPKRLAAITDASATGDRPGLEAAAHGLKGSASNMGASALAEAAAQVEASSSAGQFPVDDERLDAVADELDRVRDALRATVGES